MSLTDVDAAQGDRFGSVISTRPLPLEVKRHKDWSRRFAKFVHYWRYGYSHPDEDLLGVIDAVGDVLNVQIAAAQAVLTGDRARKLDAVQVELNRELAKRPPDFSTLLALEARINGLYPPSLARHRQWMIRERFERIAAPEAYQYWLYSPHRSATVDDHEEKLAEAQEDLRSKRHKRDEAQVVREQAEAAAKQARERYDAAAEQFRASYPELDVGELIAAAEGAGGEEATIPVDPVTDSLLRARSEAAAAQSELEQAVADEELASADAASAKRRCALIESRMALARAASELQDRERELGAARARLAAASGSDSQETAASEVEEAEKRQNTARAVLEEQRAQTEAFEEGGLGSTGGGEDPAGSGRHIDERADSLSLLNYIHNSYLMVIGREKAVRDLKRWLLMRFWLFLLLIIPFLLAGWLAFHLFRMGDYWGVAVGLTLVAIAGRIGATTSIIRRLQNALSHNVLANDPIVELTALRTGKNEISLALLSSSIFALLLYAFFASGVPSLAGFNDGIFPVSIHARRGAPGQGGGTTPGPTAAAGGAAIEAEKPSRGNGGGEVEDGAGTAPPREGEPVQRPAGTGAQETGATGPTTQTEEPSSVTLPEAIRNRIARLEEQRTASWREYVRALRDRAQQDWFWNRWGPGWRARRWLETASISQELLVQDLQALQRTNQDKDVGGRLAEIGRNQQQILDMMLERRYGTASRARAGTFGREGVPAIKCSSGADCNPFDDLANALGLADGSDFFKLLLWAFIAGFAERFVPDMLDRVVKRGQQSAASHTETIRLQTRAIAAGGSATPESRRTALPLCLPTQASESSPLRARSSHCGSGWGKSALTAASAAIPTAMPAPTSVG